VIGPLNDDAMLLAAAQALEQAFAGDATLRRPLPDIDRLRTPYPALRSLVTHPPGDSAGKGDTPGCNAV
jgi:hypothetical protein